MMEAESNTDRHGLIVCVEYDENLDLSNSK